MSFLPDQPVPSEPTLPLTPQMYVGKSRALVSGKGMKRNELAVQFGGCTPKIIHFEYQGGWGNYHAERLPDLSAFQVCEC